MECIYCVQPPTLNLERRQTEYSKYVELPKILFFQTNTVRLGEFCREVMQGEVCVGFLERPVRQIVQSNKDLTSE